MNAKTKAGDLPAWAQLLCGLLVILFSAGTAWGAVTYKLEAHTTGLADLRGDMGRMQTESTKTRRAVCGFMNLQAGLAGTGAAGLYSSALESCND